MDWYPWYPQDYRADTMHLTLAEDGAYRRLLDAYMEHRGPIPDDDRIIARMIGIGLDEWCEVQHTVRSFFHADDGFLSHKRCDVEIAEQDKRDKSMRKQRKQAAKARWGHKKSLVPGRMRAESGPDASRMRNPCGPDAADMLHNTTLQDKENSSRESSSIPARARDSSNDDAGEKEMRPLSPSARLADLFRDLRETLWPNESRLPAPGLTLNSQAATWLEDLTEHDITDVVVESFTYQAQNDYPAPQSFKTIERSLQRRLAQKRANAGGNGKGPFDDHVPTWNDNLEIELPDGTRIIGRSGAVWEHRHNLDLPIKWGWFTREWAEARLAEFEAQVAVAEAGNETEERHG